MSSADIYDTLTYLLQSCLLQIAYKECHLCSLPIRKKQKYVHINTNTFKIQICYKSQICWMFTSFRVFSIKVCIRGLAATLNPFRP